MHTHLSDGPHSGVEDVVDSDSRYGSEQTHGVESKRRVKDLLTQPELVSLIKNKVGLETDIQGDEDAKIS